MSGDSRGVGEDVDGHGVAHQAERWHRREENTLGDESKYVVLKKLMNKQNFSYNT